MGTDTAVGAADVASDRMGVLSPGVVVPVGGVLVAEAVFFAGAITGESYVNPALAVHLLTLLGCILGPLRYESETGLFLAFSLVPTFRLLTAGLPTVFPEPIYQVWLVYAVTVPAIYLVGDLESTASLHGGLRRGLVLAVPAAALGALAAPVEYAIIEPAALVSSAAPLNLLLLVLVAGGVVGAVEELLFRGVVQGTVTEHAGPHEGVLVGSVLFAALHSQYGSAAEVAFAFLLGVAFGYLYRYTDSLLVPTVAHGALNVVLFGVLPLGLL
jgi:membrane protease YdiL (CAAX protease family)